MWDDRRGSTRVKSLRSSLCKVTPVILHGVVFPDHPDVETFHVIAYRGTSLISNSLPLESYSSIYVWDHMVVLRGEGGFL